MSVKKKVNKKDVSNDWKREGSIWVEKTPKKAKKIKTCERVVLESQLVNVAMSTCFVLFVSLFMIYVLSQKK